jgi:hypothetical protein
MAEKVLVEIEVDETGAVVGFKNIEKSLDKVNDATKKTSKGVKNVGNDLSLVTDKIDDLSGGAVGAFKNFLSGTRSAVKGVKAWKVALASLGIGLIIIAVAALVELFTKFEGPLKAVDTVMNAIGASINAIVEGFGKLLSGDVSGFFSDVADAAIEAADATNRLYEAQRQVFEIQNRTIVQNAELRRTVEANLKNAADTSLALEERLEAQDKVNKATEQLIANEQELAAEELKVLNAELDLADGFKETEEATIAVREAQARLIETTAALERQRQDAAKSEREIVAQDKAQKEAAAKEELAQIKEIQDARKEAQKEREDSLKKITEALQSENRKEVVAVQDKYAELIRLAEKYGQDTVELERLRQGELDLIRQEQALKEQEAFFKRAAVEIETKKESESAIDDIINSAIFANVEKNERELQSDKDFAKFKVDLAQQVENMKLNIASQAIGAATSLAREGSALAKGLAVAQVTFDTIRGIQSTFATQAANVAAGVATGGAWPYIQAASAAAFGFANVSKILSTPLSGGGGGGGGSSRGGASSGPSAPSVSQSIGIVAPNQGQQGIGQQIQDGLGGATIRAYAVGQDISNQQQLDRQIASNGSFG